MQGSRDSRPMPTHVRCVQRRGTFGCKCFTFERAGQGTRLAEGQRQLSGLPRATAICTRPMRYASVVSGPAVHGDALGGLEVFELCLTGKWQRDGQSGRRGARARDCPSNGVVANGGPAPGQFGRRQPLRTTHCIVCRWRKRSMRTLLRAIICRRTAASGGRPLSRL